MQAWFCETLTGPDDLKWKDVPTPEPGAGEVRIAIRAASLNFPDILIVQGKYQAKPALPFVPGSEFSGTVEAVGAGRVALGAQLVGDEFGQAAHQRVPVGIVLAGDVDHAAISRQRCPPAEVSL